MPLELGNLNLRRSTQGTGKPRLLPGFVLKLKSACQAPIAANACVGRSTHFLLSKNWIRYPRIAPIPEAKSKKMGNESMKLSVSKNVLPLDLAAFSSKLLYAMMTPIILQIARQSITGQPARLLLLESSESDDKEYESDE